VSCSDIRTELEQALLGLGGRRGEGETAIGIGENLYGVAQVDMVLQVGRGLEGHSFDLNFSLAGDDEVVTSGEPADGGYAAAEEVDGTGD